MDRPTPDQRFPRERRLRRDDDFRAVFARKCSAADAFIVIYARLNDVGYSRLGLSVSKKHGSAVRRNRWKRLFREAFRLEYSQLPQSLDLVMIPKQGSEPNLASIRESLCHLTQRLDKRLQRQRESDP
ncbi:MAG: ribonuclease P protein component [Pirellulales bacterium]